MEPAAAEVNEQPFLVGAMFPPCLDEGLLVEDSTRLTVAIQILETIRPHVFGDGVSGDAQKQKLLTWLRKRELAVMEQRRQLMRLSMVNLKQK